MTRSRARAEETPPAEDERELRRQLDEVETALRAIEDQIRAAEGEKAAAEALISAVQGRAGSGVEMWRAEEQRDSAESLLNKLVVERRPLQNRRNRLASYLTPIDLERRQIAELTTALPAWEKLAEVLPLFDQICRLVDEARELSRGGRREFSVPPTLDRLSRSLSSTAGDRSRMEHSIRSTIEGHKQRIARLQAGDAK